MPKQIEPEEFATILRVVARHPDGVRAGVLEKQLKGAVSHRTLIRRLGKLVSQGQLRKQGQGRALVYVLPSAQPSTHIIAETGGIPSAEAFGAPIVEVYVPVSRAGEEVRDYVRRPVQKRTPVGYQREFLDTYVPNRSYYLPESIRHHLHVIGRSPSVDRPAGTYARHILNRLLIDLSWASSRLEGNTYSRLDTQRLIDFGQTAVGKDAHEAQMILNHKAAIEFLIEQAEDIGFNQEQSLPAVVRGRAGARLHRWHTRYLRNESYRAVARRIYLGLRALMPALRSHAASHDGAGSVSTALS